MGGILATIATAGLLAVQAEYFPLEPGSRWTYRTPEGKAFAKRVLGREEVGGVRCAVLQFGDTRKHWVEASAEGVRVHRSRGIRFERPLLLFRFPLKEGDRWTGRAKSRSGPLVYRFETVGEEEVSVPAGRYRAVRVDWSIDEGKARKTGSTWLARGVGPVKEAFGNGSVLELERFEAPGDTYYPLASGSRWVFRTDYDEETRIVHEVAGTQKVGDVECFVVERQSRSPIFEEPRVLGKEWLHSGEDGVRLHKVRRGRSEYAPTRPFLKLKHRLEKGDEWGGETRGGDIPPKYQWWVEEEEDVKVPAGTYRARRIRYKVQSGPHTAGGFEWWARNVGLVKYELNLSAAGFSMTAELEEYVPGGEGRKGD